MSSPKKPSYRFYPSILASFDDYLNAEELWMSFYGQSDEPGISLEDYEAKLEQDLIDKINRVPFVSEAASRGTALNVIVDCLVENRKPTEEERVVISRVRANEADASSPIIAIRAELDGLAFDFDIALVREIAEYFDGSVCQHLCMADIKTQYGMVELYGYADYIKYDRVFDLKITSKYSFGKYERGYQKDLYPYCLIESGEMTEVASFEYTVYQLTGGNTRNPLITGTQYKEEYIYDHGAATVRLREISERLIEFLEANRQRITDRRIFYEDE